MSLAVDGAFTLDTGARRFAHVLASGDRIGGVRVVGVADPSDVVRARVLDQCTTLASAQGVPLIRGRASIGDYGIFVDAFDQVGAEESTDRGQDAILLLRGLFRSLRRPGWARDVLDVPDYEHHRLHRAVCAVLGSLAGSDGLVLVLDDLHLADDHSLALLDHLVRRGPSTPIVLVLAHDPRLGTPRLLDLHSERIAPVVALPVAAHRLTQRELTVLAVLAEGLTADAIARRLEISPRTVHRHLQHLYRKLGTTDRLATVLRAKSLGLLP
jgi:DNA-binding CsgD family transcriptional regulator